MTEPAPDMVEIIPPITLPRELLAALIDNAHKITMLTDKVYDVLRQAKELTEQCRAETGDHPVRTSTTSRT
jgi:hypothetical protein